MALWLGFKSQVTRRSSEWDIYQSWAIVYECCNTSGCIIGLPITNLVVENALGEQHKCKSTCQNVIVLYLSDVSICSHAYTVHCLCKVSSSMMGMYRVEFLAVSSIVPQRCQDASMCSMLLVIHVMFNAA